MEGRERGKQGKREGGREGQREGGRQRGRDPIDANVCKVPHVPLPFYFSQWYSSSLLLIHLKCIIYFAFLCPLQHACSMKEASLACFVPCCIPSAWNSAGQTGSVQKKYLLNECPSSHLLASNRPGEPCSTCIAWSFNLQM